MEVLELSKESGLRIIEEKESMLLQLANDFKGLKINGVDDKEGFNKVDAARKKLKAERVQIENDAYTLRESALKFQKTVIQREKELIGIIKPIEAELFVETTRITEEKDRLKKEDDDRKNKIIQDRIDALNKFNYAIDYSIVSKISDEQYNEIISGAKVDYETEQNRLSEIKAEEDHKKKSEEDRLKAEREELDKLRLEQEKKESDFKAEQDRLRKERDEFDAKVRAEQKRKEDELKAEQDRIDSERRKLEEEKRIEQAKKDAIENARKEQEETERLEKLEIERQETLKPDKQKLIDVAHTLMSIELPVLNHDDAKVLGDWIAKSIVKLSGEINNKAAKL